MKNIHELHVKEDEELLWLRRPNILYILYILYIMHGTNSVAVWQTLTQLWIITGFNF